MKEEKSFWEKLKRWIDGDEVLLDADEIISKKEKKEFIYEERIFPIGDIRSNVTLYCVLSVFVTVVFIAVMLHVVMELPMFGDPNSITNNEVAARYLEKGIAETLDAEDSKLILKKGAKCLAPVVILYGIYVVLNGHLSPGGGFSGGSIIGAGLILYSVAFGHKKMQTFFTIKTLTLTTAACLLTYCGCKSYSFFTGANHVGWEVPKGTPGAILSSGFILPLNICVGLVVACTMYGFYALFTKGEV